MSIGLWSPAPSSYVTQGEVEDPAWVVASEEITDIQASGLVNALHSLDERSRDIVESRWLQQEKTGLKELAEKYGVSMERIRQIESSSFKKMQPFIATA